MKIAIVSINLQWLSGGTRQIFSLAKYLKAQGDEVTLYTTEINPSVYSDLQEGLDIRIVPAAGTLEWQHQSLSLIRKIFQKLIQRRNAIRTARRIAAVMGAGFDVVNYHDFAHHVGRFCKKKNPRIRTVWTMNEPPYGFMPKSTRLRSFASRAYNAGMEIAERKYLRAADAVAVLATWEKRWAEKRGLHAVIVRSGLEFSQFYAPVKSLPVEGEPVRLLTIGSPNRYRRIEDAVAAVKILRAGGMNARLSVIAKNIWGEDEYCESIRALVRKEGLEPYVALYFDGVDEAELKEAYAKSHVFLHVIHTDPPRNGSTWGLVVFEAMAAGLPVVIVRTAGSSEPLSDGENALFVDPKNPEQLAEKTAFLVSQPERYARVASAGQEFVKNNISWTKYMGEMKRLFQ